MSHRSPLLNGVEIVTMCDVDNPLCGPNGASAVFGPQKGADPDMVTRLDRNLRHLSEVIRQDLGREIADLPGAGAAGGMGAGVMAFLGSRLQMGIETVLDTVGFDALLPGATAVLTGEGRIDCQSLRGKVVIGIAHRARQARVPVVAVVGDVAPGAEDAYQEGVTAIVSTNRRAVPWEVARQSARADLCAALEDLFRLYNAFRAARCHEWIFEKTVPGGRSRPASFPPYPGCRPRGTLPAAASLSSASGFLKFFIFFEETLDKRCRLLV